MGAVERRRQFIHELLKESVSSTFDDACKEWDLVSAYVGDEPVSCLCGEKTAIFWWIRHKVLGTTRVICNQCVPYIKHDQPRTKTCPCSCHW